MVEYKNYNLFALQGDTEISDAEVCENLGLDLSLAGTPKINDAAISKMQKENFDNYVEQGLSPEDAMSRADTNAELARARVKKAMSK